MPTYWFDVFTPATWIEVEAHGFTVTGFSEKKHGTVKQVRPGDIFICYLKGSQKLVGALRAIGAPFFAREPRIWKSQEFPARVPVEPVIVRPVDEAVDFRQVLSQLTIYRPDNMRSTWAFFQGSPKRLQVVDGELLLAALHGATASPPLDQPAPPATEGTAELAPPPALPPVVALIDPLEALIRELEAAQREATKPARFERAVGDAFAFLGFEVQLLGQASHTDVLIDSRLGHDRFRAVVDTKANGSGKVPEGQINWPAIQGHQRQATADYAAVVGERFAGGNMHKYASDFGIALVDTAALIELLRLHAQTPFPASDLRPLLATAGPVAAVVADLRQKAEATDRHWQLIVDVITLGRRG